MTADQPPQLILASQSIQRKELLAAVGLNFSVVPAEIDERAIQHHSLGTRAQLVAAEKAKTVATQHPNACIVSADTFLVSGGVVLEKPSTSDHARQMLELQSGSEVSAYTGCCVWLGGTFLFQDTAVTRCKLRPLSKAEIDRYVTEQAVTTWAGGFTVAYLPGISFINQIDGSYTGLLGLPLDLLLPVLKSIGYKW